jgi:hypothetical protein
MLLCRLEKICKARDVPWHPGHFYGTLPLPSANPEETVKDVSADAGAAAGVKGKAVKKERDQDKEDSALGTKGAAKGKRGAAAKAQQQDSRGAAGKRGKAVITAKQEPVEPTVVVKVEDELADVKLEDDTSTGGSGDAGSRGTTSDSKPGKGLFSRLVRGAGGKAKEEAGVCRVGRCRCWWVLA